MALPKALHDPKDDECPSCGALLSRCECNADETSETSETSETPPEPEEDWHQYVK
jgi:hypothetical protein